jgi:phospholipase C
MAFSITCHHPFLRQFVNGLPVGGGFRVPCIIVSPWTTGGWVCSQPFDHTSVLQFLEKFTGVRESNISDWRRSAFGDLTSAFRFQDAPQKAPALPDTVGALSLAQYSSVNLPKPTLPGADQREPKQETGQRSRVVTGLE